MRLRDALARLRACPESLEWVDDRTDPAKAWAECPSGPWLVWVLVRTARTGAERREAIGVVCAVVRELTPSRDPASERALALAEAWCRGEPVAAVDLRAAAYAARAAARASASSAVAASARASADASAYAAAYASAAADASYAAAYAAASAAASAAAYATAAGAIRRRLPSPPAWVLAACEVRL